MSTDVYSWGEGKTNAHGQIQAVGVGIEWPSERNVVLLAVS
jgi:hypothetical protein